MRVPGAWEGVWEGYGRRSGKEGGKRKGMEERRECNLAHAERTKLCCFLRAGLTLKNFKGIKCEDACTLNSMMF